MHQNVHAAARSPCTDYRHAMTYRTVPNNWIGPFCMDGARTAFMRTGTLFMSNGHYTWKSSGVSHTASLIQAKQKHTKRLHLLQTIVTPEPSSIPINKHDSTLQHCTSIPASNGLTLPP